MSNTTRILITGGNRGLGLAYAKALLSSSKGQAYRILITARSSERAQEAAKALDAERVKGYGCDVESQEQVDALVERLEKDEGQLDLLINNAGMPDLSHLTLRPAADER
jgi:NAD(P)-dependent dehydrogenase (short-subunit alcohol dehydrogenase family)